MPASLKALNWVQTLDKMLLESQRRILIDKLTDWWCFIEDFKRPDVVSKMAAMFLRIERQLLGRHLSARWFLMRWSYIVGQFGSQVKVYSGI